MRPGCRIIPAIGMLIRRTVLAITLLAGSHAAIGCATTAPARLDLGEVVTNPEVHRNKRVELTGYVFDYEPARGDVYRTLYFTVGSSPEEKIGVGCEGYTAGAIEKASRLVEQAFEAREPITVVGKVRIETKDDTISRHELQLESVRYREQEIVVTRGRKTSPGFEIGGWHVTPSIGIQATIIP